jgi:hypothetical protein
MAQGFLFPFPAFIDWGSMRVLAFALAFTAIVQSSLSAPSGACRAIFSLEFLRLEFRLKAELQTEELQTAAARE